MTSSAESAVRRFLAWIDDPSTAIDQEAVDAAETAFAAATDPIERLHAAAARERASAADAGAIEADFVAHAKAYADAESIPASAFLALGVSAAVLERAGFGDDLPPARRGSRRSSGRSERKARAAHVPVPEVKAAVARMPKRFTLAQVAEEAGGGSPVTVRKAVDELIAEGRVAKLGPALEHTGPGRAPTIYELV